ncbi:MAG: energy-coupling factor transporter transmembrane protein EcfT [Coriobacteriales bacterium]|jgi:energy-coupling factor transport system permease protein|nr:energy-coupling factor transporter transmembrane protein EcfT [Coriobacteriales bacterium]
MHSHAGTWHPWVLLGYFVAVIGLTMCALHPIYAAISLVCAWAYLIYLKGWRAWLRSLPFYLLLLAGIVVLNVLTNFIGLTVLFRIGSVQVTQEALVFGISAGLLLSAVMAWFSCFTELLGASAFIMLFGRVSATLGLMTSMVFGYVPGILARAQQISAAQSALIRGQGHARLRSWLRQVSTLMGWSMEASITTAASMKARGYGERRRTSYQPLSWTRRDIVCLLALAGLVALNVAILVLVLSAFRFYPYMSILTFSWAYLPFTLLCLLPLLLSGGGLLLWKLSA